MEVSWKEYKRYLLNRDYTLNPEDITERLRVKFYRGKKIFEKVKGFNEDFLNGFCSGAELDEETIQILFWLYNRHFKNL